MLSLKGVMKMIGLTALATRGVKASNHNNTRVAGFKGYSVYKPQSTAHVQTTKKAYKKLHPRAGWTVSPKPTRKNSSSRSKKR